MKLEKISNYVLYALSAIIVISFLAFFLVGYDNMEGEHNAPKLTGFLLVVQYMMGLGGFLLLAWSVFVSARLSSGSDEVKATGLPGSKIILGTCVLTIVALGIGFATGIGEEDFTTTSGVTTSGLMVQIVDMFMVTLYVLGAVSVIALAVSATGVLAQKVNKM